MAQEQLESRCLQKDLPKEKHICECPSIMATRTSPTDSSPVGGVTAFWLHPICSVWDAELGTSEIFFGNQKDGF